MEKEIWIIKAVVKSDDKVKFVDDIFAVTSEEQAKKDVETLRRRYENDKIKFLASYKTEYIYKKIKLYE